MIDYAVAHADEILLVVTSVVTAASVIAKLTPTPKDDVVLEAVMKLVNFLALSRKAK